MKVKILILAAITLGVVAFAARDLLAASQQCFPEVTCRVTEPPATQTIAAGDTVVANACGTIKNLTAAGAVTTSTTNTFDAPDGGNKGCIMAVCNVGSNNITLDANANFLSASASNVVLAPDDCVFVGQRGTAWTQLAPPSVN